MFEKYFFDIPVFRCKLDKVSNEKTAQIKKVSIQIAGNSDVTEEHIRLAENWSASQFSSFRYGEMVGIVGSVVLIAIVQVLRGYSLR